jgi:hypothetical protein
VGRKDIEGALKRLDRLTHEEALIAAAQSLSLTHAFNNKVTDVGDKVDVVMKGRPRMLASPILTVRMLARWKGRKGGSRWREMFVINLLLF